MEAVRDWLVEHFPIIYACLLSALIGAVRVLQAGGKIRNGVFEAVLCGTMSASAIPLLGAFGSPPEASAFLGAFIGAMGVERVRMVLERVCLFWLGVRGSADSKDDK